MNKRYPGFVLWAIGIFLLIGAADANRMSESAFGIKKEPDPVTVYLAAFSGIACIGMGEIVRRATRPKRD